MDTYHTPVLLHEVLEGLDIKQNGVYFDGTCGGAGHSSAILEREPTATLVATDKDGDAIAAATERLKPFEGRYRLFRSDFKNYEEVLESAGVDKLDGFLLDLGVSSYQLDTSSRGFTLHRPEAPLDMRMNTDSPFSARDVVNGYSREELIRVLRDYGEERFAPLIANNIVKAREHGEIKTCGELVKLVEDGYPARYRTPGCARQSFQAIRIEVNGELEGLAKCIEGLLRRLKQGGRGCVITFHSLEDRIVKQVYRDMSTACVCPKNFPVCVCGKRREIEEVGRKPIVANEEELKQNSRSKSAKLRIAVKL